MKHVVVEIPCYKRTSGGIRRMLKLATTLNEKYKVHLRIQSLNPLIDYSKESQFIDFSVGLPDETFPKCDVAITYSDSPYGEQLSCLPQVKKVLIYMLSYGMCFEREKKNVFNPNITVMSSTLKIKKAIENDGRKCKCVSFGLNTEKFYCDMKIKRKRYAALLYHFSPDKQYEMGVKVCNALYDQKLIDGTIVFGMKLGFDKITHPNCLISSHLDASQDKIREVFCKCKLFIMPSISEGLNMTPLEAALCGCPSVICDGAFGDIFFDGKTCIVAQKKDFYDILEKSKYVLRTPSLSTKFKANMEKIVPNFTWEKTILNIEKLIN